MPRDVLRMSSGLLLHVQKSKNMASVELIGTIESDDEIEGIVDEQDSEDDEVVRGCVYHKYFQV